SPIEKLIRLVVSINPDSLHITNENNKTPLDLVDGEYKTDLIRYKLIEMTETSSGDTLLHDIVKSSTSTNDFEQKIKTIDPEERRLYALTFNNAGELPFKKINPNLDLIEKNGI